MNIMYGKLDRVRSIIAAEAIATRGQLQSGHLNENNPSYIDTAEEFNDSSVNSGGIVEAASVIDEPIRAKLLEESVDPEAPNACAQPITGTFILSY
jgi:hypothetical protein